jgi:hypothetical protein
MAGERLRSWRKPEPNRDTPPDSLDPTGPCPRCGNRSNFAPCGSVPVAFVDGYTTVGPSGQRGRVDAQQVTVLECMGCKERIVVVEDKYIGDQRATDRGSKSGAHNYRGVWWWPPPGVADLDAAIPLEIADAYGEGIRCMWANAPNGAATMFRRTLEGIVKKKGSDDAQAAATKNLAAGLRVMADEGVLDKSLAEWAKEIRIVANSGAHFDLADEVSHEEAEKLSRLIRAVLHYLYEMPALISRTRTQ